MTAPLPLRFCNPVKELASKYHLDYETLVGNFKINRDALINAEIQKPIEELVSVDRKLIKHKKEYYDRKYGGTTTPSTAGGETEDTGISRYTAGLLVSTIRNEPSEMDKSALVSNNVGTNPNIKTIHDLPLWGGKPWVPGRPY
jgi:hypothetical protein